LKIAPGYHWMSSLHANPQKPLRFHPSTVTLIVVNYNWQKWLKKCLAALLDQSFKRFK
jgi:hypothetical protein